MAKALRLKRYAGRGETPSLKRKLPNDNTTKTDAIEAAIGCVVAATRGEQMIAAATVPRCTTQHTEFMLRIVPILAPLPNVASHIIQSTVICRKTPNRTRTRVSIV